ncbi:hypothetical protein ACIGC1_28465 [Peribacillus butanolivorans]|uniref:hypothetical protein n=1 Tax=Peribacillus butanolivorans TaxID=421767 RepID=UPI0037CA1F50
MVAAVVTAAVDTAAVDTAAAAKNSMKKADLYWSASSYFWGIIAILNTLILVQTTKREKNKKKQKHIKGVKPYSN